MSAQHCPICSGPVELVGPGDASSCPSCGAHFGAVPPERTNVAPIDGDAVTIQGPLSAEELEAAARRAPASPPRNPFSDVFMLRYEMAGYLGCGSMGSVFLMRQLNLDRLVAVKAVRGALSARDNKRLLKEAKVIASLNHPNIRAIHDVGIDGLIPYMICEYVDGEPLSTRLNRDGALPPGEALRLAIGILEGLAFAHEKGVVHRDLKPGNIMVSKDGRPKLVDFGLATIQSAHSLDSVQGRVLGTPRYMSPEQCLAQATTPSTDIYAMGVVLFEMITGQSPFDGPGPVNYMDQHIHAAPRSLIAARPEAPALLETSVLRALAKRPEDRHTTATELAEELITVFSTMTSSRFLTRPTSESGSRFPIPFGASPGTVLAERYELVRALGRGELGEIWLARDSALEGSEVTIRTISTKVWNEAAARANLVREAKNAIRLAHPNIVRVMNLEPGLQPFLVGEFVEGQSLATELAERHRTQRPYAPAEALPILDGLTAALDHAHARGVLHRDFKPSHVVLEPGDGGALTPRITDFGIAGALLGLPTRRAPMPEQVAYRSPEQLSSGAVDPRSDVYSLAAVVYHMLATIPPLPALDDSDISWPEPRGMEVSSAPLPPEVAQAVLRALARDPERRPASAGAFTASFRSALAAAADRTNLPAPGPQPPGDAQPLDGSSGALTLPGRDTGLTRAALLQLATDEAFKDGVLEEWENRALAALTEYLEVTHEEARVIARQSKASFHQGSLGSRRPLDARTLYSKALYFAHEGGAINEERGWMLAGLRKLFAITDDDHTVLLGRVRAKLGF